MVDGIREALRHAAHEIYRRFLVVERGDQRQGVDKHTHRVRNLHVATAIGYRNYRYGVLAYKATEGGIAGCEIDGSGCHTVLLGEGLHGLEIRRQRYALLGMRQVSGEHIGNELGGFLHLGHLRFKELLSLGSNLLFAYILIIGVGFLFDGGTVESTA